MGSTSGSERGADWSVTQQLTKVALAYAMGHRNLFRSGQWTEFCSVGGGETLSGKVSGGADEYWAACLG